MLAGLFVIYLVVLALILHKKKNQAFFLVIINLVLSVLMLIAHSTDALNIRL
jgi:hypothetical protein